MPDPFLESAGPLRPNDAADSDPAEDLLAACLAVPEAQQARAIEQACARHPELAGELRSRVAALRAMGIDLSEEHGFPEQLGDFRLIKILGGGGMGVVYLAVQTSLQRDVALKLIRPEHLFFAGARARFRREAEAVARLQHPGIVPIYAIGEDQGIPYFAMELVRGGTLAEALRALRGRAPESLSGHDLFDLVAAAAESRESMQEGSTFDGSWVEAAVRIARQVADALQHAHERGLVHRDVKPSNIALTSDGRALLLDFGLTRADDGGEMTRSGSALGTLHYMSPEQVRGARTIDARSDVYSLGVTLYEMLALQVPFRGEDSLAIQRLVLDGRADPIRPRNRRVDPELETVVSCAIDRDPARRYASCADFARDLGHWLAHRPIEARRPGALLRARRWAQRHPALGTALVLGPALSIGAALALFVSEKKHSQELALSLADTRAAYQSAQRESTRATREAETARQALDFVVGMFAPKTLAHDSGEHEPGKALTVPEMFAHGEQKIEAQLGGDARSQARMFTVLARVFERQDAHEKALELCERARALWRGEDISEVAPYVAATLLQMGETLSSLGRVPEACACWREALPLWPDGPEWAAEREQTFGDLSRLDVSRSSGDELEIHARVALDKELARPNPDPRAIGCCRADLGLALLRKYRVDEAAVQLQAAFDALIRPDSAPERDTIVLINNLAQARRQQGRFDEALPLAARAMALARAVYPEGSELLGILIYNQASLDEGRGALESAMRGFGEAATVLRRAVTPAHPETLAAESRFADLASRLGRCGEAEDAACRVLDDAAGLRDEDGAIGRALATLARCAEARGNPASAVQLWREAICHMHLDDQLVLDEAEAHADLARLRLAEGSIAEADTLLAGAVDLTHHLRCGVPRSVLEELVRVCRASGREAEADSYAARIAE